MELLINREEDMIRLGERLARVARTGDIIYLIGELGVGKTTLVKGLARGFGYAGKVTSPTFTLMNVYEGETTIYHCDFYRLAGDDTEDLGIGDLIGREGVFIVEWPQVVNTDRLPAGLTVQLELAADDYEGPRRVMLQADSDRARQMLEELKQDAFAGS